MEMEMEDGAGAKPCLALSPLALSLTVRRIMGSKNKCIHGEKTRCADMINLMSCHFIMIFK